MFKAGDGLAGVGVFGCARLAHPAQPLEGGTSDDAGRAGRECASAIEDVVIVVQRKPWLSFFPC